jgi:signal transduction histidine kinase
MYIANQRGLLLYDGVTWELLPLPGDRPSRRVARGWDGRTYIGASGTFGYVDADSLGQPAYQALQTRLPDDVAASVQRIGALASTPEGMYFFDATQAYRWDGKVLAVLPYPGGRVQEAIWVNGALLAYARGDGWLRATDDGFEPHTGYAALPPDAHVFFIQPWEDGALVVGTATEVWRVDADEAQPLEPNLSAWAAAHQVTHGLRLTGGTLAVASRTGGVALVDPRGGGLQHVLNQDLGLQDNDVKHLGQDDQGGLWMALERGVARADVHHPLTTLDARHGLEHGIYSFARHNGALYAGTSSVLYRLDPAPGTGAPPQFTAVNDLRLQIFALESTPAGLLLGTEDGVYQRTDDGAVQRVTDGLDAFTVHHPPGTQEAFVGYGQGVQLLRLADDGTWTPQGPLEAMEEAIHYLASDPEGTLWASSLTSGLWQIDRPGALGLGAEARLFASADSTSRYGYRLALAGDDVFVTHGANISRLVRDESGQYRMQVDEALNRYLPEERTFVADVRTVGSEHLLALTSAGSFLLPREADGTMQRPMAAMPPLGIYALLGEDGPTLWAGADDRIVRYAPRADGWAAEKPAPLIRRLATRSPDSTVVADARIASVTPTLTYATRDVRFAFAAPAYRHPEETRYQYRLHGLNADWSDWSDESRSDYTNLEPGTYTFEVRAETVDGTITPTASATFTILPPWYQTLWAYLLYALLAGLGLAGLVQLRTRTLQGRNEALEAEVASRTAEVQTLNGQLRTTNSALREANEAKSNLLSMAVHDLKNPLASIRGVVDVLHEEGEANEEMLRLIRSSTDHMLAMISDVLASSAIESGHLQLAMKPVDLAALGHTVVESFEEQARRKEQTLRFHLDAEDTCTVRGDTGRLHEVCSNLVSNALKYSPPGAPIDVTVGSTADTVTFAVTDEGPGLTDEDKQGLFKPFNRLSAQPTGDESSTGLGLHIVRRLTRLHDGAVDVETTPGEGSTFAVRLPRHRPRAVEAT